MPSEERLEVRGLRMGDEIVNLKFQRIGDRVMASTANPISRIGSSYRKCLTAAARNAGCWAATMRDATRERARGLAAEPRGPVNLYHLGSL